MKEKRRRGKQSEVEPKEWQCTQCKKDISDDEEEALPCEICDIWRCRECINIPAKVYKYLEANSEAFPFICTTCSPKLPEMREMMELKNTIHTLQEKVDSLENKQKQQQLDQTRLVTLELQVEELTKAQKSQGEVSKLMSETVSEIKARRIDSIDFPELLAENPPQKLLEMITTHVQPTLKPMINTEISERDQIEAIKMNLIISGMPENTNPGDDETKFTQMIKDEMDLVVELESVERLQRKTANNTPKMLRVVFKDMRMRKAILSKATTLRNSTNDYVKKNIYIRPDLTKKQLEESKNLSDQLRAKRDANPGRKYKIYRGRIIETNLPQPEPPADHPETQAEQE